MNLKEKVDMELITHNASAHCKIYTLYKLTFTLTVSTYLVPNNVLVIFAKLTLMCSQEVHSLI